MAPTSLPTDSFSKLGVETIVQKVRTGDVQAFSEIVDEFYAPIRWFVFARCPLGGDPESVVQNVFVAALNEIERYTPDTDFRAWLFTIARYKVLTECQKVKRESRDRSLEAQLALAELVDVKTLDLDATETDWIEALESCLSHLPSSHQVLVRLRYERNMNLQQIATETSRSIGALKKTFFAIRQRLRLCIERRIGLEQL
jgi:RNA polymerase sigma-70 factor, ECF subfamily